MKLVQMFSRLTAMAATAVIGFHSGNAVSAGNMLLTISGFPAPIEVLRFSAGVYRSGTRVNFQDASFSAPESAALPKEYGAVTRGQYLTSALLQVVSPVTSQLLSDWTFTNVKITYVGVSRDVAIADSTGTNLSFAFDKVVYRVFAADGSVAQQVCWGVGC